MKLGHIVKLYSSNIFLCTIKVVGDRVMHYYYMYGHNILMLNGVINGPQAMGQKLRRYFGEGGVNMTIL